MASKAPQSRVLAALASLSLDASNVPKPLAPIFQRAPSAPAAIHPHPRKPQTLAPPLKATRSAPLPTRPITPATEAPLYSYKTISPAPRVRLARTEAQADTWVAELDLTGPISVDCEWVVSFHKGLGGGPRPVSLIQIADKRNVVLIQLRTTASSMTRFPRVLQRVLEDATIYKAGANILNDAKKLFRDYGVLMAGVVELGSLARQADPASIEVFGSGKRMVSLAKLVNRCLGKELSKAANVRISNWEDPKLHEQTAMLEYAANDAYAGYQVYAHLLALAKAAEITLDKSQFTAAVVYPNLVAAAPPAVTPLLETAEELPPVPPLHLTPDMSEAGVQWFHIRAYRYWALGKRSLDNMCQELRVDKQAGPLARGTVISYIVKFLELWPKRPLELGALRLLLLEDLRSWERHYDWFAKLQAAEANP